VGAFYGRKIKMAKKIVRKSKGVRFRAARVDGSVGTLIKTIESKFKLPTGCVMIVRPGGGKIRSDARLKSVFKSWGEPL
jgi:hypothetical protein